MALADIARNLEDGANRRNTVRLRERGWQPRLTGFAGWGSIHAAKVLARAVMANSKDAQPFKLPFLPSSMHSLPPRPIRDIAHRAGKSAVKAQRGWRQFFTTQIGFLPVSVRLGKQTVSTRTDRNGYVDLLIEDHGLEPGWHEAVITPAAGEAITAPVMIVSDSATTGLVSDIDDTIVVTSLPRAFLAAYNSFVLHTNMRQPVPGMADFYRTLLDSSPEAPVFYLSTGAWNVYSTMLSFIQHNDLPIGPMLLTDWGPTPTGLFRSGQEHKKTQLRNLLIMFPNIKWYLIGDDGQHDPIIYDELAREFPQRVRGIALRTLNSVEQVLSHGTREATAGYRKDADIENRGVPIIRGEDGVELLKKVGKLA
ncbi:phosphatase domain-containing protein [Trueperella pyogenes]|uniref:App1 family protein n=1 Tax=Trueperella pyogenes TaxID=1661 RepID=UPI000E0D1DDF|nr:phosphatase domain-containing protein [Trueperella pyogenes]